MRICHDGRLAKYISHDKIGLFRPTPGRESRHPKSSGTQPSYSSQQHLHTGADITRLTFSKPTGCTYIFQFLPALLSKCLHRRISCKRSCTTTFTLASVHCAARRTLTSSMHHHNPGYNVTLDRLLLIVL